MTANDMTNRDAAQIAALPKSAVWSVLAARGVPAGSAGSCSLTSERTENTSSPAASGGRPKRPSLGRRRRAREEVRETMREHITRGSVALVALTGGLGGGRAPCEHGRTDGVGCPQRRPTRPGRA